MIAALLRKKVLASLLCSFMALYFAMLLTNIFTEQRTLSIWIKYSAEVLCFFIALYCAFGARQKSDAQLLLLALLITLIADAIFLFAQNYTLGVAVFCFAHLTYIKRYQGAAFFHCLYLLLCVLVFCLISLIYFPALPILYLLAPMYGSLIFLATYYGFHAKLPRQNSILVQLGMILFLLCDANTAISYLLRNSPHLAAATGYFEWLFYLPALALLSLSSYDFNNVNDSHKKKV